jgi:ribose transport system permease protein
MEGVKMEFSFGKIKKGIGMNGALIGLLVLVIIFGVFSPVFFSAYNFINIARQCSTNLILAVGMTFIILTGGIDLSVGGVMGLVGTMVASLLAQGSSLGFALVIGLLIGVLLGTFNGICVANAKIPPFITTMATLSIARALALLYTNGYPITGMPKAFTFIGSGKIAAIPVPVIIAVIIVAIGLFLLKKTVLGRYIYALGGNEDAARLSGINVKLWKILTYSIHGFFTAIAGIVLTARMNSGQPTMGTGIELDIIAAVVIGGTSLSGGEGGLFGTIIGALLITVLNNGLTILNVNSYLQGLIIGIVILIAVFMDKKRKD